MDKMTHEKDGVRLTLEVIDQEEFDNLSYAEGKEMEERFEDEEIRIYIQADAQASVESSGEDLLNMISKNEFISDMKNVRYYEMVVDEFERGVRTDNPEAHREQVVWLNSL